MDTNDILPKKMGLVRASLQSSLDMLHGKLGVELHFDSFLVTLVTLLQGVMTFYEEAESMIYDMRAEKLDLELLLRRERQAALDLREQVWKLGQENTVFRRALYPEPRAPKFEELSHSVKFLACCGGANGNSGKITAIKMARELYSLGLKDAKDLVEAWMDSDEFMKYNQNARLFFDEHKESYAIEGSSRIHVDKILDLWTRGKDNFPTEQRFTTVTDLIKALTLIRGESPLRGETCVVVCREGSEMPDVSIKNVHLDRSGGDDSALVQILISNNGDISADE